MDEYFVSIAFVTDPDNCLYNFHCQADDVEHAWEQGVDHCRTLSGEIPTCVWQFENGIPIILKEK